MVDLCKVLSVLPAFVDIFDDYSRSAEDGARVADRLVLEALAATAKLYVELLGSPDLVWRYPPFVLLGVKKLGLEYVDGFPEFAVDLGLLITRPWYIEPLTVLGLTIALVGFLLGGPLTEAGLAGAAARFAVGFADLAATGGSAALTFLEQREQDIAAVSGKFNTWTLTDPPDYLDTALAAAASLMCAIAVIFSGAQLIKGLRARVPGTPHLPDPSVPRTRLTFPSRRYAMKGNGNRLLRRSTGTRARFAGRPVRPEKAPDWDTPRNMSAQERRTAATGTYGGSQDPAGPTTPPKASVTSASPTVSEGGGSASAPVVAVRPTAAVPPGRSTVADSSFPLSPFQRQWRGPAATANTEKAVGAKLQKATKLPVLDTESEAARTLSVQGQSPPITEPVLLEQPIITDPAYPPPRVNRYGELVPPLASAQPDYVYLTPQQIEIFEVTQDSRFRLIPQNRGTQFRGITELPRGSSHKEIQIEKVKYLITRYPDLPIVYNIQTIGQIPEDVVDVLRRQALVIQNFRRSIGATGEFQIILRADVTVIIP